MIEKNAKNVFETIALDLGFVADKYYSAKEKMFMSVKGDTCVGGIY